MIRLYPIAAVAACAFAQSATIQGTVREIPDNSPIAGVQVTLSEQGTALATTYTGNDGTYEFRSVKPGNYDVEVAKPGYWWSDGSSYMGETGGLNTAVSGDAATVTRDLSMVRPGTVRGRVVDENGNPIAGLTLGLSLAGAPGYSPTSETTDAEGRFAFGKLMANRYVVRAGPRSVMMVPMREFTEDDIGKVDEDYPVSYWPGGSTDAASILPVVLPPGGDIDIGDLRPQRVPLYRALIRLRDEECSGNLSFAMSQPGTSQPLGSFQMNFSMPCAPEYLFTGLTAGRWRLRVIQQSRWAMADFEAGADVRPVEVRLQNTVTITGRLVPGEGVQALPALRASVSLIPETTGVPTVGGTLDADNRFTIERAPGVPFHVQASLTPPYYAAEFRYGDRPLVNGVITPVAGAELEIVVDDKRGSIAGTYNGGDGGRVSILVYQSRDGRIRDSRPGASGIDGRFTVPSVPPGTYQILAIQESTMRQASRDGSLQRLLSTGQTVVVRRGETTNVSLRVQ